MLFRSSELDGQEHCVGLPPAGNTTCTMMMSNMVKLNASLPGGGYGAALTLSQTPCADGVSCCNTKRTICAKWAGAHLVSAGCIQYGVLEVEAAFDMPANSGAFYFTCVARGPSPRVRRLTHLCSAPPTLSTAELTRRGMSWIWASSTTFSARCALCRPTPPS